MGEGEGEEKPGVFMSKNRKNLVRGEKSPFPNVNAVRQRNKLPSEEEVESLALEAFKLGEIRSWGDYQYQQSLPGCGPWGRGGGSNGSTERPFARSVLRGSCTCVHSHIQLTLLHPVCRKMTRLHLVCFTDDERGYLLHYGDFLPSPY